jgi:hypothetical protein
MAGGAGKLIDVKVQQVSGIGFVNNALLGTS